MWNLPQKQKRLRKNNVSRNQANIQRNVNKPLAIKTNNKVESIFGIIRNSPNDININKDNDNDNDNKYRME